MENNKEHLSMVLCILVIILPIIYIIHKILAGMYHLLELLINKI